MAQVFISYASKDAIFADLTKMKLKEAGIRVWLDHGNLRGGDEWRDAIDQGIATSDVMLVVLTPSSCESSYVTYEWGFALGMRKKVIPILLEDANIHPRLEVLQYLDFRDPRSGPWNDLAKEIEENASKNKENDSSLVGDMTSKDLQEIIVGAVALANATAKSTGQSAEASDISRAAESVVGAMQHSGHGTGELGDRHILWVDDRPQNNVYERRAFEALGFTFTLALSTDEALQLLEQNRYAAIISDMGRVEGPREGYALLDALRKEDKDTPFFIYAGSNAPKHKREAADHGVQGSTNNPQELFDLVAKHIM